MRTGIENAVPGDPEPERPQVMELEFDLDRADPAANNDMPTAPLEMMPAIQHLGRAILSCRRAVTAAEGHPQTQQAAYDAMEVCLVALARSLAGD